MKANSYQPVLKAIEGAKTAKPPGPDEEQEDSEELDL